MMHHYHFGGPGSAERVDAWLNKNSALRDAVIAQLTAKGPLLSRDVEDIAEQGWISSGWTNDRNVNRTLDFLWTRGELMVAGRSGGRENVGSGRALPPRLDPS